MKTGFVLEGGAMRGMYTAGVLDVLMEHDIWLDGLVGVSAGALFGSNYKSKQIGRSIRYNKRFSKDPRYMSLRSLITTGDLYGEQFCYHEIPDKLDMFDRDTYEKNPVDFYVTCTDVHTGAPVYHLCNRGDAKDIQWMRASASMPGVSRVVSVDGYDMLDGGISDSIPVKWFLDQGYDKAVVVLTRNLGYQKKPNKMTGLMKPVLRKYPAVLEAMKKRHEMYNAQLADVKQFAEEGRAFVIAPSRPVTIKRTEKDPEKLQALYDMGREDANDCLDALEAFLHEEKGHKQYEQEGSKRD